MWKWLAQALVLTVLLASSVVAQTERKFVVVSDYHFDPLTDQTLVRDLLDSEAPAWPRIFASATSWKFANFGEDANYPLLISSMEAIENFGRDADFILYPGDFVMHNLMHDLQAIVSNASQNDVAHMAAGITNYLALAFQERFPNLPIIPALGNTDSYCGDYKIEPGGDYLKAIKSSFRNLVGAERLHHDFDESFEAGGYYALAHPTSEDATIIVLNNIFWSEKYENACGDGDADPGSEMMSWLEHKLEEVASNGHKAWMIYHIPAGFDAYSSTHASAQTCKDKPVAFWRKIYEDGFRNLILRYQANIHIGFMGHTHHDSFRLYHDDAGDSASFGRIVPAVSPIFGNSPGFQIYTYNPEDAEVLDYTVYYLPDLKEVAQGKKDALWKKEYGFASAYDVRTLNLDNMAAMAASAAQAGQARSNFARFYPVSHGRLQDEVVDSYLCAGMHQRVEPFVRCFCGE